MELTIVSVAVLVRSKSFLFHTNITKIGNRNDKHNGVGSYPSGNTPSTYRINVVIATVIPPMINNSFLRILIFFSLINDLKTATSDTAHGIAVHVTTKK